MANDALVTGVRPQTAREAKGLLRGGQRIGGANTQGSQGVIRGPLPRDKSAAMHEERERSQTSPKMAYGVIFWLLFGVCVLVDMSDVISTIVETLFGATLIGAPISVLIIGIVDIFKIGLDAMIAVYLFSLGRGAGKRLVIELIGAIIELIPFVDLLPLCTISFVLAVVIGGLGNRKGTAVTGSIVEKVRSKMGPVGAVVAN